VETQLRRRGRLGGDEALQARLGELTEAVRRAEANGAEGNAGAALAGILQAAAALTRLCQGPELRPTTAVIDEAVDALRVLARLGAASPPAAAGRAVRVLLADHDAQSRDRVRALLDAVEAPVELSEVGAGLQAAVAAEARPFDLVIVNFESPEALAGVRAIRRNERQTGAPRVPIVAVVAVAAGSPPADQALEAGADLAVAPPVTAEALLAALASGLRLHSERLGAAA
jgi:CheY-like chemotaxis protein